MHTNSLDEALALPTREAALLALRTQQVIAHESGLTDVVDPFGGSYFLERMTLDLQEGARGYFAEIDRFGGMVEAIEEGYPQREIAESAYKFQKAVELGEQTIIGVNEHTQQNTVDIPILQIDDRVEERQIAEVQKLREKRDSSLVEQALDDLRFAAVGNENVMPSLLKAVRAYSTVGEMCDALRGVWGEYEETPSV